MIEHQSVLFALLIILSLGLIIPIFLRRFGLPLISLLIIIGAIFGPNFLDIVRINEVLSFFGFLGMIFLMVMTGLEMDVNKLRTTKSKMVIMSLINGGVPFITGLLITKYFGYSWTVSLLVGIVFISSSVAIIVPILNNLKFKNKDSKHLIQSSILFSDVVSLILLGIVFQKLSPITKLPLNIYFPVLIMSIYVVFKFVPMISYYFIKKDVKNSDYENKLRYVIFVVFLLLLFFSLLGVHPILAAFITGLALSGFVNSDKDSKIYNNIHVLSYGLFIPVFFFIVGMQIDFTLFRSFDVSNLFMISIIVGLILSKIISGMISGFIVGMPKRDYLIFGIISTVQLTTTLAVTYTALSFGIFDPVIVTSVILLSIITTLISPIILNYYFGKR